jgi:SP family galactose:H+ symporter-like MFS transporter
MSQGSEASARRARRNVVLTAAIAGLGGLLFGYDTGIIAGALLFIKQDFDRTLASIVAIVSLTTYVASFAISLGPIFWLLNAEIYPLAVRSKAAGLGTMANWTFNFIVSLTFLLLIEAAGRSGAFWIYGGIGILTLWFCWKFVPETKGKRLEDIQAYFQAKVDHRKTSG